MTLVLVNAYSSLLISYLTIPTLNPAAKNYDDLTFRRVQKNIEGGILEKNSLSAFYLLVIISSCFMPILIQLLFIFVLIK